MWRIYIDGYKWGTYPNTEDPTRFQNATAGPGDDRFDLKRAGDPSWVAKMTCNGNRTLTSDLRSLTCAGDIPPLYRPPPLHPIPKVDAHISRCILQIPLSSSTGVMSVLSLFMRCGALLVANGESRSC